MKNILYILILFAYACQSTTAQKVDETLKKDQEFEVLLKKVQANNIFSLQVQAAAQKTQSQIVTQTVEKITNLNETVTTLKLELNEVKAALDSVSSDTGVNFIILPISKDKENRSGLSGNHDSTTRRLH
jgi:hypothetical protein